MRIRCWLELTRQEEKEENHDERVSEVQESRGGISNIQFGDKIVDAVGEQIECSETTRQEATPPPVIILKNQFIKFAFNSETYSQQS